MSKGDLEERVVNVIRATTGDDVSFDEFFDPRPGIRIAELAPDEETPFDSLVVIDDRTDTIEIRSLLGDSIPEDQQRQVLEFSLWVNDYLRLGQLALNVNRDPELEIRFESVLWEASGLLETTVETLFNLHFETGRALKPLLAAVAEGSLDVNGALLSWKEQIEERDLAQFVRLP